MMNCSIHNYKEWIGAYIEGNLNREDMLSAEAFLQKHPQLMDHYLEELEEFAMVPEEITFNDKDQLSIDIASTNHINQKNFIEYFIGDHEGELSSSQKTELEIFLILNPKLKNEYGLYGSTKLKANTAIQYPDKKELLKKERPTVPLFWTFSAAASIILLVSIWIFWPTSTASTTNGMAVSRSEGPEYVKTTFANNQDIEQNDQILIVNDQPQNKQSYTNNNIQIDVSREVLVPIEIENNKTADMNRLIVNEPLALKTVPPVDALNNNINEDLASVHPQKKGLLNKIFSGEKTYIEDYVNATFTVFKNDKNDDDKWVLKVDRDQNGKSKKIKFTSPIFSVKSRN